MLFSGVAIILKLAIMLKMPNLPHQRPNLSDCRAGDEGSDFACVSLLYGTNRGPKQYKEKFYGYAPLPIGSPQILGEVVISLPKPKGERRKQDKIEKTALYRRLS